MGCDKACNGQQQTADAAVMPAEPAAGGEHQANGLASSAPAATEQLAFTAMHKPKHRHYRGRGLENGEQGAAAPAADGEASGAGAAPSLSANG